jgi:hypothetical protein
MMWLVNVNGLVVHRHLKFTRQRFRTLCLFHLHRWVKVKVKAAFRGLFGTAALCKPIVPSPLGTSFTTRGAVYQPDTQRTLLAKEGTIGIWPAISQFSKGAGFFYKPQSWDMGQIILLPLRRKACCGFFQPEKSDGFGRERTRDLGYQRPAC